jgi:hypothetical protein
MEVNVPFGREERIAMETRRCEAIGELILLAWRIQHWPDGA